MKKIILRKLLATAFGFALFIFIFTIGSAVLLTFANFFQSAFLRLCILVGIPLFFCLRRVYRLRLDNNEQRTAYCAAIGDGEAFWQIERRYLVQFTEFRVECLIALVLSVGGELFVAIPLLVASEGSPIAKLFAVLSMLILFSALSLGGVLGLWVLVHRRFYREHRELHNRNGSTSDL